MMDTSSPWTLRNAPVRPREWRALIEVPGATHIEAEGGELVLAPDLGQLRLHWAYSEIEEMRRLFPQQFEEVRSKVGADRADYVVMDLVNVVNRDWFDPMLRDADFDVFAEWMDMVHPAIGTIGVPEFPAGVTMRRAAAGDTDRIRAIWQDAYGDYAEGTRSFDAMLAAATWTGVLEVGGEIAGFAMNGDVERGDGTILTAAVAPEHWGNGYGKLVVGAAAYQLASKDATRAIIRVRPDIKQALRTCSELGFRHLRSGIEFRRLVDEAAIFAAREARRVGGVKARFGEWR